MLSQLLPIAFNKVMQSKSYTAIVLGNETKKFAIYVSSQVGRYLQQFLTDEKRVRPATHDLLLTSFEHLDVKPLQVVIYDVQDTVYFAHIFLEQNRGELKQILQIDARPSDCIILALTKNIPLYCSKEVFEKTIPFCE